MDGFDFVAIAMGLFGISEVLESAGAFKTVKTEILKLKGAVWISWQDLKDSFPAYIRGTAIGFVIGSLPGAGGTASSFISYLVEKKVSKHPERFGHGAIEGVAGPETANNAAHQAAMVPLLTLGIPPSAVTALLLGALMMYGLQPGPLLYQNNPQLIWGIFVSMYVANVILVVLNLPLVNIFAKLLDLPGSILYSMVVALCVLGVYATRMSNFDVGIMLAFGVIGYFMRLHKYPLAPMLLGMVLGDMMEQSFRRSLILSNGDATMFFTRPISATLLAIAFAIIILPRIQSIRRKAQTDSVPIVEDPNADADG
jgi:putative tricarboxylic transport membrane protein